MDVFSREQTIQSLYQEFHKDHLGNPTDETNKPYFFNDHTSTWYALTGRSQMDRPAVERALRYFENELQPIASAQAGTPYFNKALCLAIAIEGIERLLKEEPNGRLPKSM